MRKLLNTTIVVSILASLSTFNMALAVATPGLNELPTGQANLKNMEVTTPSTGKMDIKVTGGQGSVGYGEFNTYNVGQNATVNYQFTAHSQTAINKVTGTDMSAIFGKITNSCGGSCGYDSTGKVILINPNGILFGNGANVNLNSFTASTYDGTYDEINNKLNLTRNSGSGSILVGNSSASSGAGAILTGGKNISLVSDNITQYAGSKISTGSANSSVRLVTGDGINFSYTNHGGVDGVDVARASADIMNIKLTGDIESEHIDVRNASTNKDSSIQVFDGATLKATSAVDGKDGNIYLVSNNKVVISDANLTTKIDPGKTPTSTSGDIAIVAGKKVSINKTKIDSAGSFSAKTEKTGALNDVVVENSDITAAKDVTLDSANDASVQVNSKIKAANINLKAKETAQVLGSNLEANKINIDGNNVIFSNALLKATNKVTANARKGDLRTVAGTLDLQNSKAELNASNDVNVNLKNVGERRNGLIANAGHDMTINTDGTLSVASLISENDMTLNADKIISGFDKTKNVLRKEGDSADRAYIEVGGTFKSNPDFEVTDSADLTSDGKFNKRHHIQYENGTEKILLVNKRPVKVQQQYSFDKDQSEMLNKMPRQPESFNNTANITNSRTALVDVFAAASQIEIEDDEEE